MEPTKTPVEPSPKPPVPVMDVVVPPKPSDPPVIDATPEVANQPALPDKKPEKPNLPPKSPKQSSTPTLAIFLAVVVFLALAGLSYYAYSKTK
ncbi:MAG: hypothetical protein WC498_04175 [Candidatus Saccharimonadales bacterium]